MKRYAYRIAIMIVTVMLWWSFSCGGDGRKPTLEGNLLDYNDVEMVTFTIAGNAVCQKCEDDEIPIEAMQIEVFPKDGELTKLALKMYDGLGRFSVQDLTAASGQVLEIQGKLMRQGESGYATAYYGYAEVTAPDDDDDVVGVTLHFPSSEQDDE